MSKDSKKSGRFQLKNDRDFSISPRERRNSKILLVEPDANDRDALKGGLRSLGFGEVVTAKDHASGLEINNEAHFTHVIFAAASTNMPAIHFCQKVVEFNHDIVAVPSSSSPSVDDVFEMLRLGARGYLVKPFTAESVELSLLVATKGEPLSDVVLESANRNAAFAALIAGNLDRFATTTRQARKISSAKQDLERMRTQFIQSIEMGKMFAEGGDDRFVEDMVSFFISLAQGPASRLGRLRKRLRTARTNESPSGEESSTPAP